MRDKTQDQIDFENQLGELLQARAAGKEVTPDLEAITSAPAATLPTATVPAARSTTRTWWLVAAALVVSGGIGISRLSSEPANVISTEPSAAADEADDSPSAEQTTPLLVWIKPDATSAEIEEMAELLVNSPAVLEIYTVRPDGEEVDFDDQFTESADGVQLVDPGAPPTAFKVLSTNPGDVGDLVTDLGGLDGVENTE